jgi:BolA family transcriptional regulator, general stress-responsive regulator
MTGPVQSAIRAKLEAGLAPALLVITDDSARHAHHAGARAHAAKQGGGAGAAGETHFTVEVVSAAFEGLNRIARQRLVFDLVAEELTGPVHAFALSCRTPTEAGG